MKSTQKAKQRETAGLDRDGLQRTNQKKQRELARKIQAEDVNLEIVHPDAAGIDIGNERITSPCRPPQTPNPCGASAA